MIVLEPITDLNTAENKHRLQNFNDFSSKIKEMDDKHIFLFLYLDGCHPCELTKEPWNNIKNKINSKYLSRDVVIAQINQELFDEIKHVGDKPYGFPTLRYINNHSIEEYNGPRTTNEFVNWISRKLDKNNKNYKMKGGSTIKKSRKSRKSKKSRKSRKLIGGKWSTKYKKSINCNSPKGFSQKQYCKYSRN